MWRVSELESPLDTRSPMDDKFDGQEEGGGRSGWRDGSEMR
jgi:hypothetical protein